MNKHSANKKSIKEALRDINRIVCTNQGYIDLCKLLEDHDWEHPPTEETWENLRLDICSVFRALTNYKEGDEYLVSAKYKNNPIDIEAIYMALNKAKSAIINACDELETLDDLEDIES